MVMAVPMPGLSEKRIWPHATAHTCPGFGLGLGPGRRVGSGLGVGVWAPKGGAGARGRDVGA